MYDKPMEEVFIMAAKRTPLGGYRGILKEVSAPSLGGAAMAGALEVSSIAPEQVEQVVLGQVLPAGAGQAPARQAARAAGIPASTPAHGVAKVCASGMEAITSCARMIRLGEARLAMAGGMESMSRAPYLLPKDRAEERLDHMIFDGLICSSSGESMGALAEQVAKTCGFSRREQEAFAARQLLRAKEATEGGIFASEIVPLATVRQVVQEDELPKRQDPELFSRLKPIFSQDGTITAATSSKIADGAAALVLAGESLLPSLAESPLARIVGWASHSQDPAWYVSAPVGAIGKLLERLRWRPQDADLWEINEAFAISPLYVIRELRLDEARVNIFGGACALGHPLGVSGARIVVTLLTGLAAMGARRGVASICAGGGEAMALAVEMM